MKQTRQTSINCYNQIKSEGLLTQRRFEVFGAIFKNAPCTTNEALKDVFSGSHGIGSRTTELRDQGVIYETGVRKCKVTNRNVIEWDLTDNLPSKLMPSVSKTKKQKILAILEKITILGNRIETEENKEYLREIYKSVKTI